MIPILSLATSREYTAAQHLSELHYCHELCYKKPIFMMGDILSHPPASGLDIYIYRYHWYRWTYIRDYIWIYDLLVTTDWGIWHNHSHHTAPGWWCRCWCGRGRCRCTPLSEWSGQLNLRNNFENGIKWIYTSKERYLPTWNGRDCATQNGIRSFNFKWWNNCLTYHHAQRMYLKHHVNSDSKRIRRYSNNPI